MKLIALLALTVGLGSVTTFAQDGTPHASRGPRGPGQSGGRFPMDSLMTALDTNTNSVIEATEIASASDALKKLDKNNDGKLKPDELKPQLPDGGKLPSFTPPGGGKPPVFPLMKALDTNSDGELDAAEIANASAALKKIDANSDGKLSRDELMPKPPEGFGGPGGASEQDQ